MFLLGTRGRLGQHHGSKGGLRLRLTAGGGSALSKITCLSVDMVSVASAAGANTTTGSVVMTTVTRWAEQRPVE